MPTGKYIRKIIDPKIRFLKKVKKTENCWFWTGYKNRKGYGSFVSMGETLAHRFSYLLYKGQIPENMQVCHHCDNPSCVNPEHLWVGTNSENQIDCVKKGRAYRNSPKGENNGISKLTDNDVREIRRLRKINKTKYGVLAKKFNISESNIFYILSKRTWSHVSE